MSGSQRLQKDNVLAHQIFWVEQSPLSNYDKGLIELQCKLRKHLLLAGSSKVEVEFTSGLGTACQRAQSSRD